MKASSCGTLAVIPQGTLDFESDTVDEACPEAIQEEDFERVLFARHIENMNRFDEDEE